MPDAHDTAEQVAERGEAIYRERIRELVESENWGQFVVIDIKTEDYEVHENDGTASKRLLARQPEGVLYGLRIGSPTAYHLLSQREVG